MPPDRPPRAPASPERAAVEVAVYPARVGRAGSGRPTSPSRAFRLPEDPARAAAASQTAGSRWTISAPGTTVVLPGRAVAPSRTGGPPSGRATPPLGRAAGSPPPPAPPARGPDAPQAPGGRVAVPAAPGPAPARRRGGHRPKHRAPSSWSGWLHRLLPRLASRA